MRRELGKYIVADPKICHGALTFRGTRVLVAVVLEQVAMGMDWQAIVDGWRSTVSGFMVGLRGVAGRGAPGAGAGSGG